ncbi:DNA-binding protein [Paenibacillus glucanolyticus]|jgi:excisionase family DNA binding protein|uniref:helix-turn-helix domain-containing protein n=1 Tax=Paenibacillus glucanolyticus TaxID=59843 RepID=UPI000D1A8BAD|nr:helix-turn-helix domain-containing protein [Paenibacillus glucanolyticus]AVV56389.1 DNA-binding protein [Paenibacillus glucanolyticus]MPY19874.1 helix-turn-helix domain-containing protein [Paenibacillus glucanolyticus]
MTATSDLIDALRADIVSDLKQELLSELQPEIERRLYSNIFDIKEAARYRKVSVSTLRRMVKDGEIPYFRQRGQLYFRQIDLDKNIENLIVRKEQ